MGELVRDLMRPKTTQWCYKGFIQADRSFDCTREKGHSGECDSLMAQERRQEYCQQLVGASEGV